MSELQPTGVSLHGVVDALDALLADGVAVSGDVVIGLDGIELIKLDLRLLLAGIQGVPAGEGPT
jgi:ABC-type thiamine transport system substrate-binding protein